MANNSLKIPIPRILKWGCVGIIIGLLTYFLIKTLISWLNSPFSEVQRGSYIILISTNFWIFFFCSLALFGLIFFLDCKHRKKSDSFSAHAKTKLNISLINPSEGVFEKKSYELIFDFMERNSSLFTILATIIASISLIQVFTIFSMGDNWLTEILSGQFGFQILILIIISLFLICLFTYYILALLAIRLYYYIIKNDIILRTVRIEATIFISTGILAIGCIFIYLIVSWFAKFEYISSILGFYLFVGIGLIPLTVLMITHYWNFHEQSKTCVWKTLTIVMIIFLIIIVVIIGIATCFGLSLIYDNLSKYHSNKTIIVSINADIIKQDREVPVLLILNKTTDAGLTNTFTFLDGTYAECHWSTNYGYFLLISSNNSIIKRQKQELSISGCGELTDKTYWTYDVEDYNKNKPPVIIGLTVIDSIKKRNNKLGDARIMLIWTDKDTFDINYNVTNISSPF